MKKPIKPAIRDLLEDIGLSPKEALCYLTILGSGELSIGQVARQSGLKRGIVYKVCQALADKKLINLAEKNKIITAQVQPPDNLLEMIGQQEATIAHNRKRLTQSIDQLKSTYEGLYIKPNIRYTAGSDAVDVANTDVLNQKQDIYLVRSPYDTIYSGLSAMKRQRENMGLWVKAITPNVPDAEHDPKVDKKKLIDRKWIDPKEYTSPVQIQTYGDRVSFVNYLPERFMGIIIEDKYIAEAMRQVLIALRHRL